MDQLKTAAEWCKRHIFWIGCFLLAATMIGSWVFSSMQLAEAQRKRQSEIEKQVKAIEKVSGTTAEVEAPQKAHPNPSTQAGMDAEIAATIASIVVAWQKRYDEQKAILTWPEDILGAETCNFFSRIDIPEKVSDPGHGFEKFRKSYYDNIPRFMNKICDDLGVNWQFDEEKNKKKQEEKKEKEEAAARGGSGSLGGIGGSMSGMGGSMGGPNGSDMGITDEVNKYAVIWDELNQALWQQKLTTFVGYDDHVGTILYPTFMQANMLQQDLWLLEAMFKNIKEINNKSTSNDTSTIRTIDYVVFGREAIIQLGQLMQVDGSLAGMGVPGDTAAGGMDMGGPGDMNMGSFSQNNNAVAEGEIPHEPVAYHKRYVDPNFEAIAASQVKAVLGGIDLPETNLELIVAKRVPFRIAVEMDERKINEFIAICANSDFVFEVNQLRINRHTTEEVIKFNGGAPQNSENMGGMGGMGAGGMGAGGLGAGGMGGGMSGGMMGGGAMGSGGSPTGPTEDLEPTLVESRTDFMVSVEFYGVVKIYNPVRENFLRKAAGQEVVDDTVDLKLAAEAEEAAAKAAAAPRNAAAQPGAAQPGAAQQPAVGQTAVGQPAVAQPAVGQPAGAQPAGAGAQQPAGARVPQAVDGGGAQPVGGAALNADPSVPENSNQ